MSVELYSFYARAMLTESALDTAGRIEDASSLLIESEEVARLVAIDALDSEFVDAAHRMSVLYTAIAAFENSVRDLIISTLSEEVGENWWEECVSKRIKEDAQKRKDAEDKVRWHAQRGSSLINYTMLPNLAQVIAMNHDPHFEPFIHSIDWAKSIFNTIERSRNVVMHSGSLEERDLARVGSAIRDWVSQVSA